MNVSQEQTVSDTDKVVKAMNALIDNGIEVDHQDEQQNTMTKSFYGLPNDLSKLLGGDEYFNQYIEFSQDENAKSKIEAFADKFNNKLSKDEQKQLISAIKSVEGNNSKRLAKVLEIGAEYYSKSAYGAIKEAGSPEALVEGLVAEINKLKQKNVENEKKQRILLGDGDKGDKVETPLEMEQREKISVLEDELVKMQNPYNQAIYAINKQKDLSEDDVNFVKTMKENNPLDNLWDEKVIMSL